MSKIKCRGLTFSEGVQITKKNPFQMAKKLHFQTEFFPNSSFAIIEEITTGQANRKTSSAMCIGSDH